MSNTTRNALILLIFLILFVALGGYYVLGFQPKQIKSKQIELENLNQQFLDVYTLTAMYDSLHKSQKRLTRFCIIWLKPFPSDNQ